MRHTHTPIFQPSLRDQLARLERSALGSLPGRPAVGGDYLRDDADERGDVPGWVMVTLMTVALVIAIWAVAGPALVDLFNTAIERVKQGLQ